MKIMVIDDEEMMREMLFDAFDRDGVEVLCCDSGAHALSSYQEFNPDTVILDLMMPEVDGFEVCAKIKKDQSVSAKIIILTGMAGGDVQEKAQAVGADQVFLKPISINSLKAEVFAGK